MPAYLLGLDIGSSSVKACLVDVGTGTPVASAMVPSTEMEISSPRTGWAEQDPATWWEHLKSATHKVLRASGAPPKSVAAIGISYQMHGLVIVDERQQVLRPSIIWCDSRAVGVGEETLRTLGEEYCYTHLLNAPGNFTAMKLKWVKNNEPGIYDRINKLMLPGDYIAMRLTGEITTTASGLSEGVLWDFGKHTPADGLMKGAGIESRHLPDLVSTFGIQGKLTAAAASELGLAAGTPLSYRAGDQPNNAFALQVLQPGEVAATAGTSGVIYAVTDKPLADKKSRVNTFLHVNDSRQEPRLGVLLCVNGTGIMNRWLRQMLGTGVSYDAMNAMAAAVPPGAEQLTVLPFGNGAERIFENRVLAASIHGLDLVRHQPAHLCRAVQEGVAFALGYGLGILREMGIDPRVIRAGNTNMFQSEVFCTTFARVSGAELQLFNTDGAQGAAIGAGVGAKHYGSTSEAFSQLRALKRFMPDDKQEVLAAFDRWRRILEIQ